MKEVPIEELTKYPRLKKALKLPSFLFFYLIYFLIVFSISEDVGIITFHFFNQLQFRCYERGPYRGIGPCTSKRSTKVPFVPILLFDLFLIVFSISEGVGIITFHFFNQLQFRCYEGGPYRGIGPCTHV